jgi:signal transduction histidine kinase
MPSKYVPIRRKLIKINLLTSIVVIVLVCVSFLTYEYIRYRRGTVRSLSTISNLVVANTAAALLSKDQAVAEKMLSGLKSQRYISAAALYDQNGQLFSRYPATAPAASFPAAPQPDGFEFDHDYLIGFQPVQEGDKRLGTLYLRYDTGTILNEWLRVSIAIALGVMALALLVAYLISRKLQQQISQPVLALAGTARSVTERRDFSVRAQPADNDELGVLTDAFNEMLTEIEKLHGTLESRVTERTEQLQAANQELQAFSYSVSHDLRAPLRHVLGFVDLLYEGIGTTLSEKDLRYLNTIKNAAKRMGTLIDDLLAFSRIGQSDLRKVEVDLNLMVRDTLNDFREETKNRKLDWELQPLPPVWADRALLRMVFTNLVANAVKFTGGRDEAKIEIGGSANGNGETTIFVRDNGAGFDPRYIDKLFGVFQRLHGQDEFEGTGIGLANVQRIVQRHGGRCWAEGAVNQGATFYFMIPKGNE